MDRKVFFDIVRGPRGSLTQGQVDGLNFLLDNAYKHLEKEDFLRKFAYILATVKHETADTYEPIREYGNNQSKKYWPYYGRGYVQLTWHDNYEFVGKKLGVDLVGYPDKALDKDIALAALIRGMQEGWYNPKKITLGEYIKTPSYEDDRQTVNLKDKAALIAKYAVVFEDALRKSGYTLEVHKKVPCPNCGGEMHEETEVTPPEPDSKTEILLDWIWRHVPWALKAPRQSDA
jgi:hypothetical protein